MTENQKNKSKRSRSPSYPVCDLKTAIEKTKEFYSVEGFNDAIIDVAVQCWGFNSGSGSGYRMIAALLNYGLFEDEGSGKNRKVRLTELGKEIVIDEREDSKERIEAIRKAALNPPIYRKLYEKWGISLPSDANMKFFLIKELGFNNKKVERFIKDFRSTIEFAKFDNTSEHKNITDRKEDNPSEISKFQHLKQQTTNSNSYSGSDSVEILEIPIPLISGKRAILSIPIPLTKTDFTLIKSLISTYLDNMEPAIVREDMKQSEERGKEGGPTRSH